MPTISLKSIIDPLGSIIPKAYLDQVAETLDADSEQLDNGIKDSINSAAEKLARLSSTLEIPKTGRQEQKTKSTILSQGRKQIAESIQTLIVQLNKIKDKIIKLTVLLYPLPKMPSKEQAMPEKSIDERSEYPLNSLQFRVEEFISSSKSEISKLNQIAQSISETCTPIRLVMKSIKANLNLEFLSLKESLTKILIKYKNIEAKINQSIDGLKDLGQKAKDITINEEEKIQRASQQNIAEIAKEFAKEKAKREKTDTLAANKIDTITLANRLYGALELVSNLRSRASFQGQGNLLDNLEEDLIILISNLIKERRYALDAFKVKFAAEHEDLLLALRMIDGDALIEPVIKELEHLPSSNEVIVFSPELIKQKAGEAQIARETKINAHSRIAKVGFETIIRRKIFAQRRVTEQQLLEAQARKESGDINLAKLPQTVLEGLAQRELIRDARSRVAGWASAS